MPQNDLLKKLDYMYRVGFNDGQHTGQQQGFDVATVYLIRQGWSGQQLVDFYNGCCEIVDEFAEAYNPAQEQDVAQERLDAELQAGYDGAVDFVPFRQRYPAVKNLGYDRPIKEERHPAVKRRGHKKK